MANNYTDSYDGIATGAPLSAAKMTAALNTKEKVANKQLYSTDTAATLTASSSSDSYYPSSKLVGKNLDALSTTLSTGLSEINTSLSGKQNAIPAGTANDILTKTTAVGTLGTLTKTVTLETSMASASDDKIPTEKAVANALAVLGLSGKENTSNKATSIEAANQNDETKYPTIGAVTAWATSTLMDILLPAGTIIAMRSTYYYGSASATFKEKWKVCDGQGTTPNLRNLFLRGMAEGGTEAGSDSVTLAAANLPGHSHTFTGDKETGWIDIVSGGSSVGGIFSSSSDAKSNHISADLSGTDNRIAFSMTPSGSVTGGGGDPQTAVSIVPKYYAVIYVMKIA
ncbi:MAG: hypothetical protein LBK68_05740 [Candidatus Margulisbacteria bacterium]|jgi:microcystin-dependent protein|nr:hypothetical protein [Candidatus Margulisiibacteriota bacterium]